MKFRKILQAVLSTWPRFLAGSGYPSTLSDAVSRIDRCIHYSGGKSFVNNGLHESFLGPAWLQRATRVARKSSCASKEQLNNTGDEDFSPRGKIPIFLTKLPSELTIELNQVDKQRTRSSFQRLFPQL